MCQQPLLFLLSGPPLQCVEIAPGARSAPRHSELGLSNDFPVQQQAALDHQVSQKSKLGILHISTPHMWTKQCVIVSREGHQMLSTEMSALGGAKAGGVAREDSFLKEPQQ